MRSTAALNAFQRDADAQPCLEEFPSQRRWPLLSSREPEQEAQQLEEDGQAMDARGRIRCRCCWRLDPQRRAEPVKWVSGGEVLGHISAKPSCCFFPGEGRAEQRQSFQNSTTFKALPLSPALGCSVGA